MATEYRGLTIRFGGDTSKLTAALTAANKAAAATQKQLTQVSKAAKFDPDSLTNAASKLKLVENRAETLNSKLKTMRESYSQLSKTASKTDNSKSIKQLASETDNAQLSAQNAVNRYNQLNKALATQYRAVNNSVQAHKNQRVTYQQLNKETGQLETKTGKLSAAWQNLTGKTLKNFHVKDMFSLDDAGFEQAVSVLKQVHAVTDQDVQSLTKMRSTWQQTFNTMEDAKAVAELERMATQMDLTGAEAKSLSQQLAQIQVPTKLSQSFETMESGISSLDGRISSLKATAKTMDEALKVDPSNLEAAATKTQALEEVFELTQQKAKLLKQEISRLEDNGDVKQIADSALELGTEFEGASNHVKQLSVKLTDARADAENLADELKQAEQGGAGSEKIIKLKDDLKLATSAAETFDRQLGEAKTRLQNISDAQNLQKARIQLVETTTAAKQLENELSGADAEADELASSLQGIGGGVTYQNLQNLGGTLSATVTTTLSMAGKQALDAAKDFDSAYRDMRKTVDGTETQFEELKQSAMDFSNTHVTSSAQIMEIQAMGGELGIAVDDLDEFSEAVSNMSVATNLSTDEAADALGSLTNIMSDLDSSKFTEFSDALVVLGNNGASTESEIVDVANRIGSMASIVGMSTPDVLALASTIASTGQNSEAAGTAISNTMSDIETAVAQGGDKLNAFAEIAGTSAEQFARTWNESPITAIQQFIQGLSDIESSGGSADATLENLGITGVRQKQAIEGLMQVVDQLGDNLEMSNDAWDGVSGTWDAAGAAADEASKKAEGLSGSMDRISNVASNVASSFGDAIAPILSTIADLAADAGDGFINMSDQMKQLTILLGGSAAAAGPVLSLFGSIGKVMQNSTRYAKNYSKASDAVLGIAEKLPGVLMGGSTGMTALSGASKLAAGAMSLFEVALPIVAVSALVTGIGALVQQITDMKEHEELVNAAMEDAGDIIKNHSGSIDDLSDVYSNLEPDIDSVYESLKKTNEELANTLDEVGTSSAKLDLFTQTIEDLGNKGELTAVEQEKLRQAVEGYNEITGGSIEITDSASGALSVSTERIKANAEAWKYNAKQQALANAAQGYYDDYADAALEYTKAEEKYNAAAAKRAEFDEAEILRLQEKNAAHQPLTASERELLDAYNENTTQIGEYSQAMQEAKDQMNQAEDSANTLIEMSGEMQTAVSDVSTALTNWFGEDTASYFEGMNYNLETLSTGLANAGIGTEQLNAIGSEQFAQLAAQAGGSIDALVALIQSYNGVPIIDKNGSITTDTTQLTTAEGEIVIWNGTELVDHDGNAVTTYQSLVDGTGKVVYWNGMELKQLDGEVDLNSESVQQGIGRVEQMNRTTIQDQQAKIKVTGATAAKSAAQQVRDALAAIKDRTVTISTVNRAVYTTLHVKQASGGFSGKPAFHATGGVRKHAKGAIAHSYGSGVPLDVVGENGAEAIVPLTNRRYAMPFVKMISAETVNELNDRADAVSEALAEQQRSQLGTTELTDAVKRLASVGAGGGKTVNVNQSMKVVTAYNDLYSATAILNRSALREASRY